MKRLDERHEDMLRALTVADARRLNALYAGLQADFPDAVRLYLHWDGVLRLVLRESVQASRQALEARLQAGGYTYEARGSARYGVPETVCEYGFVFGMKFKVTAQTAVTAN